MGVCRYRVAPTYCVTDIRSVGCTRVHQLSIAYRHELMFTSRVSPLPSATMRQVWARSASPRQLSFPPCNPRATRTEFVCTVHSSSKCLPGHTTTRVPLVTSRSPTPVVPGFPHPGILGTKFPPEDQGEDMNASAGRNRLVNHVTVQHIRMPTHATAGRSRKERTGRSGPGGGGRWRLRRSHYLAEAVRRRQVDPGRSGRQTTLK